METTVKLFWCCHFNSLQTKLDLSDSFNVFNNLLAHLTFIICSEYAIPLSRMR